MRPESSCILILTKNEKARSILELSGKEFGFKVKVISVVEELVQISMDLPVIAWFVDLDGLPKKPKGIVSLGRKKAPDARLVFIAEEFDPDIAQSCIEEGAVNLLVKPISIPRLVKTFNQIMLEPSITVKEEFSDNNQAIWKEKPSKQFPKVDENNLRKVEFKCPPCGNVFLGTRFKLWILPVTDTDSDFCPICKDRVHPELYSVMVCPNCFFGNYVGDFNRMEFAESQKQRFHSLDNFLIRRQISFNLDFKEERALLHGIKSFELAATSALQLEYRNYLRLAGEFYLKASWLCRRIAHDPQEKEMQIKARDLFKRVYQSYRLINGRFPANGTLFATLEKGMDKLPERSVVVTCFLIGELSRRLGDFETAGEYFSEVKQLPFFDKFTSLMQHINSIIRLFETEKTEKENPTLKKK
ncbi:MAG: DUF2225 domain-containing protein [Candidatus Riflebacteria bacterium]|nr:DUF2225 domain-containing protein [Candidatus Riflebacteria bacterium]